MQMYEVSVLAEDMQTELQKKLFFAENEDDALDQMQEILQREGIPYGICQASEV